MFVANVALYIMLPRSAQPPITWGTGGLSILFVFMVPFLAFPLARQPVEKVGVGPVGGPREPENKAKTLQKSRIRPLSRGRRGHEGGFNTLRPSTY
jgi:hypothetical protein